MRPAAIVALIIIGVAPPLIAIGFVMIGFIANDVPLMWLWRPVAICVLIALIVEAPLLWILGPVRGSVWAFVAVSALTGMFVLAGATLFFLTVFGLIRSRPGMEYWFVGALTAVASVLILGFSMVIGMTRGAFDWTPTPGDPIDLGETHAGPSIHVLLLDGYPRLDVLDSIGHDNREFLAAMDDRGFDVSGNSLSNYDLTPFSILSMLSVQHIDTIASLQPQRMPDTVAEQQRIVTRALLEPPVFAALEGAGYRTRLLTADVVLASLGGAETVWNAGTANNFELDALQRTPLAGILEVVDFAAGQHQAHIEQALREFARAPTEPTFTFAHVMTPHAPFVYESDGSSAGSPPCYPGSCQLFHVVPDGVGWSQDEYWQRMSDHLHHVNELVLMAVDELVASDPEGVVIVLSDHGLSGDDQIVRFQNLTMARTPGHPHLLGDTPTPINVLPSIFNAYLEADLPMLPDSLYRTGDGAQWLSLEPVGMRTPDR